MNHTWSLLPAIVYTSWTMTKVLEYHIAKKADITVVCKELPSTEDATRFGVLKMNSDNRITQFDEKPMAAMSHTISCGIYVIRRRQLIELIERSIEEGRHDFVKDVLIRYKDVKRIYGYKNSTATGAISHRWSPITRRTWIS